MKRYPIPVVTVVCLSCFLSLSSRPAAANLLVDPGFEANPLTTAANVLTNFVGAQGIWGPEAATITGVDGGVTPAQGVRMLRMVDDGLIATQVFQATDVTSYAALIDAGGATVNLSALFNAGPNVPAATAAVAIRFFSAANWGSANGGPIVGGLSLDASPTTWQTASVTTPVPVLTRWLITELAFSNASLLGNPGYADAADLTIVPEPASLALLAAGSLLVLRRRRAC